VEARIDSPDLVSPPPLGKLAKSLPEQVADRILEAILDGRLAPGERLKEIALAGEHAVSRATVREALTRLERRQFVERVPRYGARVAALALAELGEIFALRAAMLGIAARRFAEAGDGAAVQRLGALVRRISAAAADGKTAPPRFGALSIAAQQLVIEASRTRFLGGLYEQLSGLGSWRLIRGKAASFVTQAGRRESARDWRRVAEAITRGDGDAAERAARDLLVHSAARVQAQLPRDPDGAPSGRA
jgi:DNA-binding GntR family transcriptional regulator